MTAILSKQRSAVDALIWSNLSDYWSEIYDNGDKEALTAIYDAWLQALDTEYVRASQIARSTSIEDCPLFIQKRWVRWDLHLYRPLRTLAQSLIAGAAPTISSGNLACIARSAHPQHWHLSFPWTISTDSSLSLAARRRLPISYKTDVSLVRIYRGGLRLLPQVDYTVADSAIILTNAAPGTELELEVGIDLTGTNQYPAVFRAIGFSGPTSIVLPSDLVRGTPIHLLVVRNDPGSSATNTIGYTTRREFVPFTGDAATGVAYTADNVVSFPATYAPGPADSVYVFAVKPGSVPYTHTHLTWATQLDGPISTITIPVPIGPAVFGQTGLFANRLLLSLNGQLVSPDAYRIDASTNTLALQTPYSGTAVEVVIEYTEESAASSPQYHLHSVCGSSAITVTKGFARFDDGGQFDDGGRFDTLDAGGTVQVPTLAASAIDVWRNGEYQFSGVDYVYSTTDAGAQLTFTEINEGDQLLTERREEAAQYTYSLADLTGGLPRYLLEQDDIDLLANSDETFDGLKTTYPWLTREQYGVIIEALRVISSGGDPLLALVFDEARQFKAYDTSAQGQILTAEQARNVESADSVFVSAPVLNDHVTQVTSRRLAGVDFTTARGALYSSQDLGRSWWVPLMLVDEYTLAKNFGALVGDVRPSSEDYRDALRANLRLRFGGPTVQNIRSALAAYGGSGVFRTSGVVSTIEQIITGYHVTVSSSSRTQAQSLWMNPAPPVGAWTFPGMSLLAARLYDVTVTVTAVSPSSFSTLADLGSLQPGDAVWLLGPSGWARLTVHIVTRVPAGITYQTTVRFTDSLPFTPGSTLSIRAARGSQPPYAALAGDVTAATPVAETIVTMDDGSKYRVQSGLYRVGQRVQKGDPVDAAPIEVFDDQSRPRWLWESAVPSRASVHVCDIAAGDNGYGHISLDPLVPLSTGDRLLAIDASGALRRYAVVSDGLVLPNIALTGFATLYRGKERSVHAVSGATSTLTAPAAAGDSLLQITASAWQPGVLRLYNRTTGQSAEVEVTRVSGSNLSGLRWKDAAGTFPVAQTDVTQLTTASPKRLHPAYTAAIKQLMVPPDTSEASADSLYDVIKNSVIVMDVGTAALDAAGLAAISAAAPAGSTPVTVLRHRVSDRIAKVVTDMQQSSDGFTVTITRVGTGVQSGTVSISSALTEFVLTATNITGATYSWTTAPAPGSATTLQLASPTYRSTRVTGVQHGGTHTITVVATLPSGATRTATVTYAIT